MNVSYDELVSMMGGGEAGGELEDPDGSKWRGSESDLCAPGETTSTIK